MKRLGHTTNQQILEEASIWFVTLRDPVQSELERRDFHDWMKRSPDHVRAYLEIASTYADVPMPAGGRTPAELILRAQAAADSNIVAWGAARVAAGSSAPESPSGGPSFSRKQASRAHIFALAAILALAVVSVWLFAERGVYQTTVGEQRSITLADGSIIELNARSEVRISYGEGERRVELLSGQALFRVAKDKSRPFIVRSDRALVRAVGTEFDVYRKRAGTVVTVLEGQVAVLSDSATPAALLAAGEQAIVTRDSAQRAVQPNVAAATAWTQHQLIFDGTSLNEAVEEFSRYNTRKLVIDSPELKTLRISGQYLSASPDSLLKFLSLQPGIAIVKENGVTHIRQK